MCNIFSIHVVVVMLFDPTFFPSFPLSIVSKGIIHYKNANFLVAWTWAYTLVQLKQVLNKQCAPRDKNQNYTQFLNVMYACT